MKIKALMAALAMMASAANALAQSDEERVEMARSTLSRASEKNKAYTTISVAFSLTTDNQQTKQTTTESGTLVMKGESYVLEAFGTTSYFDGKTQAAWAHEVSEVTISEPDATSSDSNFSPQKFFNFYETDYRMRYMGDTTKDGKACAEIELYPVARNTNIARVHLTLEKQSLNLKAIVQQSKDGMIYTIDITRFDVNKPFDDSYFTFDASAHPEVEVIDMR